MLGIEELPPAFVDRVCAETGGNPFFVEEVSAAWSNTATSTSRRRLGNER
jgi:hypothetical protein